MELIVNRRIHPAWNLALEEYALTELQREAVILWRNSPSVIVGRNQNAEEEIDRDYVREKGIPVVRRLSGGGAVFHDLGNINYTVIQKITGEDFNNYRKFTAPICAFLQEMGVDARLQGRNDLVVGGMKFSGNAQAVKNGWIMHHGTILYNADFTSLAGALRPRPVKIESKGIKSVRSRVTNLADHMERPAPVEEFFDSLAAYFASRVEGIRRYQLSEIDIAAVDRLVKEKYGTWEWNFGKNPPYNFSREKKFPFGLVELRLEVEGGVIQQAKIHGDFFGTEDIATLEECLVGIRHDGDAVGAALAGVDLSRFIHGMALGDLLGML